MKNKFIKGIAAIISCITIASTGNIMSMNVSASSADSGWFTTNWAGVAHGFWRYKDNTTSVYVSNNGYTVESGSYIYKGTPYDVNVNVSSEIMFKRTKTSETQSYNYDCENYNGSYYNCKNLRLKKNETRVIYQFVRENYNAACQKYNVYGFYSYNCVVRLYPSALQDNRVSYGVWSPDTSGSGYQQISGQ